MPPGSNAGPWVQTYTLGQGPTGGPWCALFCSWTLIQASKDSGTPLELRWKDRRGAKRLAKVLVKVFEAAWVKVPKPGDLAVLHRGRQADGLWSWRGHICFVERVSNDGTYTSVGGNENHRVKRTVRDTLDPRLLGFLRI